MEKITTVGIDLAKNVFSLQGGGCQWQSGAANMWLSVRRFHDGTPAMALTHDAGYTTATRLTPDQTIFLKTEEALPGNNNVVQYPESEYFSGLCQLLMYA